MDAGSSSVGKFVASPAGGDGARRETGVCVPAPCLRPAGGAGAPPLAQGCERPAAPRRAPARPAATSYVVGGVRGLFGACVRVCSIPPRQEEQAGQTVCDRPAGIPNLDSHWNMLHAGHAKHQRRGVGLIAVGPGNPPERRGEGVSEGGVDSKRSRTISEGTCRGAARGEPWRPGGRRRRGGAPPLRWVVLQMSNRPPPPAWVPRRMFVENHGLGVLPRKAFVVFTRSE